MANQNDLAARYLQIKNRLPSGVRLLCVSKTHTAAAVAELVKQGQLAFGENYLQEALQKQSELCDPSIEWHYIGHIQRNKTRPIAQSFAWTHGVDRLLIAERLSEHRQGLPPLNVLIQVNIDDEKSKSGCPQSEAADLAKAVAALPNLALRGLMIIPKKGGSDAFLRAKALFDDIKAAQNPPHWDTLSMGMSGDLDEAIARGSTMVRIGSAIFGQRPATA